MKFKASTFFLLIIVYATGASAQRYQGVAGIQYSMGSTTGESENYIGDFSFRGFSMEYDKFISPQLSIGFLAGWNIFDELLHDATIDVNGSTISGTQIRFFNVFPILAKFGYFLGNPKSNFRPYASLGVGTYYIMQRLDIGLFHIEKDNWHLGLAPAIGILIPTDYIFLQLNVRYHYAFAADDSITKQPFDISYMTYNIGITIPTW